MRMFVAAYPPASARDHLAERLRDRAAPTTERLRWTAREQWHLTLAFLADVREADIAELSGAMSEVARATSRFSSGLAGSGAFPRPARATTLWCGIDPGVTELSAVAAAVATAVRDAGLSLDDRPFRSHLTLARCQPTDLRPTVGRLADYRGPPFPVDDLALVRSLLGKGPGGRAAHEVIGRWPMAADRT